MTVPSSYKKRYGTNHRLNTSVRRALFKAKNKGATAVTNFNGALNHRLKTSFINSSCFNVVDDSAN